MSNSMMAGNNSTYRTADNINATARRLISQAKGNPKRQQRIKTIKANYLRAVGRNTLFKNEAVTNDAGSVLQKVRGNRMDYTIVKPYSLMYSPSTTAKASVSG